MREVLRRAAQHRRAADVDHLDGLRLGDALLSRDLLEGIEVDADEVERLDVLLLERCEIVVAVAAREDRRVDARMQRLHAAAEHLGRVGQRLDALDLSPSSSSRYAAVPPLATSSQPSSSRPRAKHVEARLVVGRDQRAHSSSTTRGRRRCSISLMRSCSVSACRRAGRRRAPARAPGRSRRLRRR